MTVNGFSKNVSYYLLTSASCLQKLITEMTNQVIKIAVVGDIHDQWEAEDEMALKYLGVNLVLFVGDFGNEAVEIVSQIASLDLPKAAIMGNHDAWYTASDWGRKKCPYDQSREDRVQQQLDLLAEAHIGYGNKDFPELNLSVVGSRPFSWGGSTWKNKQFYRDRYGVTNFSESTDRIVNAAKKSASETVIFLGHNGPFGLGDQPEDSCGRDWNPVGGDYGDPDFAEAITQVRASGKKIPLVVFGHMHHRLRHTKTRLRQQVNKDFANNTIYLNGASVPRIVAQGRDRRRNFTLVSLKNGLVSQISLVWVAQDFTIVSEEILYSGEEAVVQLGEKPATANKSVPHVAKIDSL